MSLELFEYEEILMGKKIGFSCAYSGTDSEKRKVTGHIWRYAILHLLHWTPEDALTYLNPQLIKELKLDLTLKYVSIKFDEKKNFDPTVVLSYAFPEKIKYNESEICIDEYCKVMKLGKYQDDIEPHRFPKNFFANENGSLRAAIVLNYAIKAFLPEYTINDLYFFFADTPKAMLWLREKRLNINTKVMYTNPLDYFHYSLPNSKQNDFLYHFFIFMKEYKKIKITEKKEESVD